MKAQHQSPRLNPDDLAMMAFWIVTAGIVSLIPLVLSAELGHLNLSSRMGETVTWKSE
jgi:hypothetical protein